MHDELEQLRTGDAMPSVEYTRIQHNVGTNGNTTSVKQKTSDIRLWTTDSFILGKLAEIDALMDTRQGRDNTMRTRLQTIDALWAVVNAAVAAMEGFRVGRTCPTPDNTLINWDTFDPENVVSGSALTVTTPGTVFENQLLDGVLDVKAPGVATFNCRVTGGTPPASGTKGLIQCTNSAVEDLWIEQTEIFPETPWVGWNGIFGHNFTCFRSHIHGTTDGIGIYNPSGNVEYASVIGSLINDLLWWEIDPDHDDGSHNDAIQVHVDADYIKVFGNSLNPGVQGTAGIMANIPAGGIGPFSVGRNWFSGGKSGVNFGPTPSGTADIFSNVFDIDNMAQHVGIYADPDLVLRIAGNIRPNGTAANTRTNS